MSERHCVRGCTVPGEHYAACRCTGQDTGCAPREARAGVMICAGCYGRARRLLRDVDDMMGRLDSLADPMKATPTDKVPGGAASVEPPAPIDADLLDAIRDVSRTLVAWAEFTGRRTIDEAFDDIANDLEDITRFGEGWLNTTPEVDGIRSFWTVADAMAKWGPERRTKGEPEWLEEVTSEELRAVPEWGDKLLNVDQAAMVAGSQRTLQRWRKKGLIDPARAIYTGRRQTALFRLSDLIRVRDEMQERAAVPRARGERP